MAKPIMCLDWREKAYAYELPELPLVLQTHRQRHRDKNISKMLK